MYPRYHLLVCTLGIAVACGGRGAPVPSPVATTPPEAATPPETTGPAKPRTSLEPATPLEAAATSEPAAAPAAAKPAEVAPPPTPSEPTNDVSNPWGPPANESDNARAARLDLRDRLARSCRTYLTTADVKKICGTKLRIGDPSEAGEPPDEWPPACRRAARRKSDFDPLRLTIDNEASAPRTVVAMSAQDRAQVRSLDLGDASLIYTDKWEHRFSRGVSIAVGKMTVSLVVAGRDENTVPCSEAQLVKLAAQIIARLPR